MTALIGFYGDDLTGSTDTLSVLARGGLATRLFLDIPSTAQLGALGDVDAIGIAGAARTMTPREMDEELPAAFAALRAGGVRIVHYKTCSTFDSAPEIGSIGHAMAIAATAFGRGFVPIVVGQPNIGRYCAFGTLFATAGPHGPAYRLDRHPTMSRHPVTPMGEADLRLHLAKQGRACVALLDVRALADEAVAGAALDALLREGPDGVLFDVLEPKHLERIGKLIGARLRDGAPVFAVGSSGLQQALLGGWSEAIARKRPGLAFAGGSPEQILVVSGSRSPVTAAQIDEAERAGFALVALD
ncbi:MAG: four-carbon acid sugar kinase family protein, partial [Alphaproteobacteria bacterium]|nr:four-carbon acid sugar kinase family protein [Alphaproteobacteria bacterium]